MAEENISNIARIEQNTDGDALSAEAKPPEDFMEQYSQEKDADLSGIRLNGKHFLIKAPHRKNDSGLILSEKQQKELQNVQETPGFQKDVTVLMKSDQCEMVEEGDMVLLNPHVQTMEVELPAEEQDPEADEVEKVLYLMVHEDYVLMAKQPN